MRLVVTVRGDKDPHWDESAKNFIEGLILHVATDPLSRRRPDPGHRARPDQTRARRKSRFVGDDDDDDDDDEPRFVIKEQMLDNAERLQRKTIDTRYRRGDRRRGAGFLRKIGPRAQRGALDGAPPHQAARLFGDEAGAVGTRFRSEGSEARSRRASPSICACRRAAWALCNRWLRIFINQLLERDGGGKDRADSRRCWSAWTNFRC